MPQVSREAQSASREARFRCERTTHDPGRTRHIHVKVQTAGGRVLTTQLYFPDEPRNRSDGIYRGELALQVAHKDGRHAAIFDFVVTV